MKMSQKDLALFNNLVALAASDGKFTQEEIEFLVVRAEDWGISQDEFETALTGVSSGGSEIVLPESQQERIRLLTEMIRMMAADGELADVEKRLCAHVSAHMNLSIDQFDQLLNHVLRN
jgi:uncharacterized tellurite resistance protein B-like protein